MQDDNLSPLLGVAEDILGRKPEPAVAGAAPPEPAVAGGGVKDVLKDNASSVSRVFPPRTGGLGAALEEGEDGASGSTKESPGDGPSYSEMVQNKVGEKMIFCPQFWKFVENYWDRVLGDIGGSGAMSCGTGRRNGVVSRVVWRRPPHHWVAWALSRYPK